MPGPYASFDSLPLFDEVTQAIYVRATAYRDNGTPTPTPIDNFIGMRVKVNTPNIVGIKQALVLFAQNAESASASDVATGINKIFGSDGAVLNP